MIMLKPAANTIHRLSLLFYLCLMVFVLSGRSASATADTLSTVANRQFLTSHAQKPCVVVRSSGLQYRILARGFGRHPSSSDNVEITYDAHLIDGAVVDRASTDLPATLTLSSTLRGLSEALQLMQTGDHWEIVVPADLALGSRGAGAIPPNQTLVFDLTLLAILPLSSENGTQDSSPFSVFSRERGKDAEAGAVIRISP